MTSRHTRVPFVGLTAFLALLMVLTATSASVPSVPGPLPLAPSREEIQALEELARWVRSDRRVTVVTVNDMAEAMRQGRRSFELFRSYTGSEAHREFLRGMPYADAIAEAAERNDLDCLLVAALVQVESGFHRDAVSPMGAIGLMQVMPSTGQMYGVADLTDPYGNLYAGTRYFSELLDYFSGDLELTLAAYNAGPGNVKRFGGVPPFPETRQYVRKVLSAYIGNHWGVWDQTGAAQQILLH
jgi:soluble lytic murein transglycosylase-like protein